MLKCKEVQDIIVEDEKLSLPKKISLKLHLFICKKCRQIKGQYLVLNDRIRRIEVPINEKDQSNIDKIIKLSSKNIKHL